MSNTFIKTLCQYLDLADVPITVNFKAMPDIVLTTLNAKFIHAAFGLRYLFANLGELQLRAVIAEIKIIPGGLEVSYEATRD